MESILTSIKKMLGITEEYEHFDTDIIMHINSVFMILNQLGVGPEKGFSIKGKEELWTDFLPEEQKLELVKSYMHLKVKLLFDPPMGSAVIEVMNRMISEFEWRLNVAVDPENEEEKADSTEKSENEEEKADGTEKPENEEEKADSTEDPENEEEKAVSIEDPENEEVEKQNE